MKATWIKSGKSGKPHAVSCKGSDFYVTLCETTISAKHALYENAADKRCPVCVEKIKNKR
jgi:hypothetical protein